MARIDEIIFRDIAQKCIAERQGDIFVLLLQKFGFNDAEQKIARKIFLQELRKQKSKNETITAPL